MVKTYGIDSLTGTSNLVDNPCLSRNMIADFTNLQCYEQKATTVTNYGNWYKRVWGAWEWADDTFSKINGCGSGYLTSNWAKRLCPFTSINGSFCTYFDDSNGTSYRAECKLYLITYTCPTHWTKLSNSTCEYREPF